MEECPSFTDMLMHGMHSKTCEYTIYQGSSADSLRGPDAIESATCLVRLRSDGCMTAKNPIPVL